MWSLFVTARSWGSNWTGAPAAFGRSPFDRRKEPRQPGQAGAPYSFGRLPGQPAGRPRRAGTPLQLSTVGAIASIRAGCRPGSAWGAASAAAHLLPPDQTRPGPAGGPRTGAHRPGRRPAGQVPIPLHLPHLRVRRSPRGNPCMGAPSGRLPSRQRPGDVSHLGRARTLLRGIGAPIGDPSVDRTDSAGGRERRSASGRRQRGEVSGIKPRARRRPGPRPGRRQRRRRGGTGWRRQMWPQAPAIGAATMWPRPSAKRGFRRGWRRLAAGTNPQLSQRLGPVFGHLQPRCAPASAAAAERGSAGQAMHSAPAGAARPRGHSGRQVRGLGSIPGSAK
jgi:hypothetical protein